MIALNDQKSVSIARRPPTHVHGVRHIRVVVDVYWVSRVMMAGS